LVFEESLVSNEHIVSKQNVFDFHLQHHYATVRPLAHSDQFCEKSKRASGNLDSLRRLDSHWSDLGLGHNHAMDYTYVRYGQVCFYSHPRPCSFFKGND